MPHPSLEELDKRSAEIFRCIVENYLALGAPVAARAVSKSVPLSPATIRNVMGDLEEAGFLFAPHISAGRVPTEMGLRLFIDGLLEVGRLSARERETIAQEISGASSSLEDTLSKTSKTLSGLSHCAGLVSAPRLEDRIKYVEFALLNQNQALVVLVGEKGMVENRIIDLPRGFLPTALEEAANYLNRRVKGMTLSEARADLKKRLEKDRAELNALTAEIVRAGVASWSGEKNAAQAPSESRALIVRGRAQLLDDIHALEDLERVRLLLDELETKTELLQLLESAEAADGVHIFIGAETKLFALSGSSVIVSPYRDGDAQIVGVMGVIGPKRLNYARIIPMVDYTARAVSRLLKCGRADHTSKKP